MIFLPPFDRFNDPARIAILLGRCYSSSQLSEVRAAIRFIETNGLPLIQENGKITWAQVKQLREAVRTTRTINSLNQDRAWARTQLTEQLSPLLEMGITIAVVPSHDPWAMDTPIRNLARSLSSLENRNDATNCLIRHTKISRIVFGGPSNPALHRETIRVENPERIEGKHVLLLDDIAKSGQSLRTCRALLYESGAAVVQAAALGRVIGGNVLPPIHRP
jgi:phosphoribosylpyrophosphate synthetase